MNENKGKFKEERRKRSILISKKRGKVRIITNFCLTGREKEKLRGGKSVYWREGNGKRFSLSKKGD